ncbi:MAG: tetratricopeptide repeat protein, partial [Anderseniella sp.]|nr:tetratricopeptide repeat protein [Anderseniella sp.]
FDAVVAEDPNFALGHAGLARAHQATGNVAKAREVIAKARELATGITEREAGHINVFDLLANGRTADGLAAVVDHARSNPRDAMVVQTSTSIFGLIGFSGLPGREAEMLAFTSALQPHYADDWWYLSQYAFALCETGQVDKASSVIDRSMAINPRNAHGAHVRSHIDYEAGETQAGVSYLNDWLKDYDRSAVMHGHLSWHVALWALQLGDTDQMWQRVDADVKPGAALGMPINILSDTASILYRAELAGVTVPKEKWREVSAYASKFFPNPGLSFIDYHAALAHAMAGDGDALSNIISNPNGPAGDLVRDVAEAFGAIANQDWLKAERLLTSCMADDARLGGSRAQRDLLEFSLLECLLKQGKAEEARRLIALRRPVLADTRPVQGL